MSYDSIRKAADVTPLAEAIQAIREIVATHSYAPEEIAAREADHDTLVEMLDEIEDQVKSAREGFLANIRAAQDAELQNLRKQAAARDAD